MITNLDAGVSGDAFWEFERAGWERAAGSYEHDRRRSVLFIPRLLDAARVTAGSRLLDVACGPGFVSEAAAKLRAHPVGVDVAAAMVGRARGRNPELTFIEGDAHRLPFEDSFAAVTMNFGILHLSRPEAALREARRVLVDGGRLAFTAWVAQGNAASEIADAAVAAHARSIAVPEGPPFYRFADEHQAREALVDAGFESSSVRVETITASWHMPSTEFLFESELRAGVRIAAVLRSQPRDRLAAIRAAMAEGVRRYADDGRFTLPIVARLSSAEA